MITVALTSVPSRLSGLPARLLAILGQRPARVCLTIPRRYERFPDWDGALPDIPEGVGLLRAQDSGPATKFIEVFRRYPSSDVLIADDDCDYRAGWLDAFRAARASRPDAAVAASSFDTGRLGLPTGHRIVQGFAGVLLCPQCLSGDRAETEAPECWVDDIWLSGQLAASGIPIVDCPDARARVVPFSAPDALQAAKVAGLSRADLNRQVAQRLATRLGIWAAPE